MISCFSFHPLKTICNAIQCASLCRQILFIFSDSFSQNFMTRAHSYGWVNWRVMEIGVKLTAFNLRNITINSAYLTPREHQHQNCGDMLVSLNCAEEEDGNNYFQAAHLWEVTLQLKFWREKLVMYSWVINRGRERCTKPNHIHNVLELIHISVVMHEENATEFLFTTTQ